MQPISGTQPDLASNGNRKVFRCILRYKAKANDSHHWDPGWIMETDEGRKRRKKEELDGTREKIGAAVKNKETCD